MSTTIFVSGHRGMVGSAICRQLENTDAKLITVSRDELDLRNELAVKNFFEKNRVDQVYLAAAKVGGIYANNRYPAEFIRNNLAIQCNTIHFAYKTGVKKLLFLGSSCIYPRLASQPMPEEALLSGHLEPTNEPYAIAKIAGIKLCESYRRQYKVDYRSVMPTNLYGPGDNYDAENSHVIPAMIRRFHEAKIRNLPSVTIWGSGNPRREFLYVDDMARACIHVMNLSISAYEKNTEEMRGHLNVGSGTDITIKKLAELVKRVTGYSGVIEFDESKPDGSPQKLMNSSRLNETGWMHRIQLEQGLKRAYASYLANEKDNS